MEHFVKFNFLYNSKYIGIDLAIAEKHINPRGLYFKNKYIHSTL